MKEWKKSLTMITAFCAFMMLTVGAIAQNQAPLREPVEEQIKPYGISYSSLTHLVSMIGEDADGQFRDFFDPIPVMVAPFPVFGESSTRRVSLLGATLADQMAVMINNSPGSMAVPASAYYNQFLKGVIQEIDGFVRIHMSGVNSRGERRSYVANIEMSKAVYRAMHTYVPEGAR